jgi:hypothetical protein
MWMKEGLSVLSNERQTMRKEILAILALASSLNGGYNPFDDDDNEVVKNKKDPNDLVQAEKIRKADERRKKKALKNQRGMTCTE